MLKKTITYTDYNGLERTENFYFNISKAELAEMEHSVDGGFDQMILKIIETNDMPGLTKIFKDIIMKSYGEKSADGKQFNKYDKNGYLLANGFAQTEAFSVLYMELASDDIAAVNFINQIMPKQDTTEVGKKLKPELEQAPELKN